MKKIIAGNQARQNLGHIAIICSLMSLFNIEAMDQTIQVYGSEGESQAISVPLNIAKKSETIKEMLQDLGTTSQAIPLSNYPITLITDAFDILSSENPKNSMAKKIQNSSLDQKIDLINFFTFYDFHDDSVNLLRKFFDEHTLNLKDSTFQNLNRDTKKEILLNHAIESVKDILLQNIFNRKSPLKRSATQIPLIIEISDKRDFFDRIILSPDTKSVFLFAHKSNSYLFFNIDNNGNIDESSRMFAHLPLRNIISIAVNHDNTKIFFGTISNTSNDLEVYNLNNGIIGEKIQSIPLPGAGISDIVLSPSNDRMFVKTTPIRGQHQAHSLFEFAIDKNGTINPQPRTFDGYQQPTSSSIANIVISPNEEMVLITVKNSIYMLPSNNSTNQVKLVATTRANAVISRLAFSPNGNTIVLSLNDERGFLLTKVVNNKISNEFIPIKSIKPKFLDFVSNNILMVIQEDNATLYDLSKILEKPVNTISSEPRTIGLICRVSDRALNSNRTKIFAIENFGQVCSCFNLLTPEEEKTLIDLKNNLTIEQAQLILALHQELIEGNKTQLSDSDNTIYASLPAEIQTLFTNAIQKD